MFLYFWVFLGGCVFYQVTVKKSTFKAVFWLKVAKTVL